MRLKWLPPAVRKVQVRRGKDAYGNKELYVLTPLGGCIVHYEDQYDPDKHWWLLDVIQGKAVWCRGLEQVTLKARPHDVKLAWTGQRLVISDTELRLRMSMDQLS